MPLVLRRLAHAPGFALVAVLSLALGIGATTAIFSIVDGVLLRPLAYPQPQQLVALYQSIPEFAQKYPVFPVNAASYNVWRRDSKLLSGIALFQPNDWVLSGAGRPVQVSGGIITASMFQVLGVEPRLGRGFLASEDQPGANHVVILTDGFWRSQFHADPQVIGRTIDLDGKPNQIVGVMPPGLEFPQGSEMGPFFGATGERAMQLFQPAGINFATARNIGNFNYFAVARLRPGAGEQRVRAELDVISAAFLAATHAPAGVHVNTVVHSLRDQMVGSRALGLWLLLGAVGAILLMVCLNLANLLLVRVHGRGHEIAIRVALGANRQRLVQETMAEGVVLALLGGALGVGGAVAALRWLVHSAPPGIPRLDQVGINPTVLAFSLVLALVCGVLFSFGPAWRAANADPQMALRSAGRGSSDSGRRLQVRAWLVGGQAALAAVLLIVAGLLTASYLRLVGVDKGFSTAGVVEAELNWPGMRPQRAAFFQAVLDKLATLPGITDAGMIDVIPTQGTSDTDLLSQPHDNRPLVERPLAAFSSVSAGYFAAIGIPLLRGRTFTDAEVAAPLAPKARTAAGPPIAAVVSANTAAKIWPGQSALGQQFRQSDPDEPLFTVVGVVADVRTSGLDQPPGLQIYLPYTYNVPGGVALALRTRTPLPVLAPALRAAVWSVQPDAAIPNIATLDDVVAKSVAPRRFQLSLVLFFALCAVLLAALGIYGVVAYSVERRTAEIGMRMTLGARPGNLVGMVLRQGLQPVVAGLVAGILAALASGRLMASLLFGIQATDPAVIAAVSGLLVVIAALACAVPALRATRVDPLASLRP